MKTLSSHDHVASYWNSQRVTQGTKLHSRTRITSHHTKKINELNDDYELESLLDNIKLNLYQEYKSD
jgi:hypothetical protein